MRLGDLKQYFIKGLSGLLLATCLLGVNAPFRLTAWAWDGNWTDARSGRTGLFENPGSTHGQAGTDPPQKYYTPNPRDYSEVDPEEIDDYFHRRDKNYTPYALARITENLRYNDLVVPKGYYLIKPGDSHDGSPDVGLHTLYGIPKPTEGQPVLVQAPTPPVSQTVYSASGAMPEPQAGTGQNAAVINTQPTGVPGANAAGAKGKSKAEPEKPAYEVFVLKRQGKVFAVVPIHRRQTYVPSRKVKIPRRALAWIEEENRHPVLKFYYKHWIYSTDFQ